MITVKLYRSENNFYKGFEVSGHAGYAPSGSDIICSAISALAHTAIASLKELTGYDVRYDIRENEGYMKCFIMEVPTLNDNDKIKAEVIIKSFYIGCRQISDSYGKKYIKLVNSSFTNE